MGKIRYYGTTLLILMLTGFSIIAGAAPLYAKDSLLIIHLDDRYQKPAIRGIRSQTRENFQIDEMVVSPDTLPHEISQKMKAVSPNLVVLMDNVAISLYRKYQKELSDSSQMVPSVSVMASFMDLAIRDLRNATGIFYEVPIITSVVMLHTVMPDVPLKKIGVAHREFMEASVRMNREYCKRARIGLVSQIIPESGNIASGLEKSLDRLRYQDIDALWVPNDNKIINASLFKSVWLPFARQFGKPIIVGVEVLVLPRFDFGTFAVIPDSFELGVQAAQIIYDIRDNHWNAEDREIEPPLSVYKFINLRQARRLFNIDRENLGNVDKILE